MEDSKESRLRAEFEAWARRSGWVYLARRGDEGHYADSALEECWAAWRAAFASRSEILEALTLVTHCLRWHHERNGRDSRADQFAIDAARAALAKYQGE
jgi:hypothetical protein